jgi:hypothetical protein
MARYSNTEQVGVHAVGTLFVKDLEWIFREQPISDMGIDAHVELVEEGEPTGQLIGVQIKTGEGNFRVTDEGLVYYGKLTHLDYWLGHSLPVVLVAHLPDTDATHWVQVQPSAIERTEKAWKIFIPYTNKLSAGARTALTAAFDGSVREQRLRRLALDEELMRRVQAGGRVSVEVEDWYNKSLGRSPIQVITYDDKGKQDVVKEWFVHFVGYGMKELVEKLFPWATARVDQEFYDENDEYEESWEERRARATDLDNGFGPYERNPDEVYPYSDNNGEVAAYRLQLFLNDMGEAYLAVSDYLNEEED